MSAPFSVEELISEVEREIKLRQWVYGKHVDAGKMAKPTADRQIAMMRQILDWLKSLEPNQGRLL